MIIDDINKKYILTDQPNYNPITLTICSDYGRRLAEIYPDLLEQGNNNISAEKNKSEEIIKILNNRMDEIIKAEEKLNKERSMISVELLTTVQAVKFAISDYLKGEDKKLDQQASALEIKREQLKIAEKENIAYGKECGFDKTMWRYVPELFKGHGLKSYESALASFENKKKQIDLQEVAILAKRRELEEQLQITDAQLEIAKKSEEYLRISKQRFAEVEQLNDKLNTLQQEKNNIIGMMIYHQGSVI